MILKKILPLTLSALFFSVPTQAANSPLHSSGPMDPGVVNEEKLIEMLSRSGKIPPHATLAEAKAALKKYLAKRIEASQEISIDLSESAVQVMNKSGAQHRVQTLKKSAARQSAIPDSQPESVQLEAFGGERKTARVLAVLMEFPDFPHNSIQPGDTDMYYEDYNREHYQELLFSKSGVTGPNGETFISMINYYEAQSGGSYSVEGTVAGWYMAEHPAAYYGGNVNSNDANPRALIREALLAAAADPSVNLADFDVEDRYDLDGDGNFWEPDGLVDHVQVFHSSVGEEAGGGQLGEAAIWSHRWNLFDVFPIPGTTTDVPYWGGVMAAFDYTIQPADAAAGVVSHEYGHDLGLPDEYDTQSTGAGEPVSFWSIMSSGSWAGIIPGSEPTGFSAWAKEFLQEAHGGNWLHGDTLDVAKLPPFGTLVRLDQAVSKGRNNDAVRIDLPDKKLLVVTPASGEYAYHGGSGNDLNNSMALPLDLTGATDARLQFKAWYNIEQDWDYAYVMVDDGSGPTPIPGNITIEADPNGQNQGHGITGNSSGWVDAEFDLSAFAGKFVELSFVYWTDVAVAEAGIYIDDLSIVADGNILVSDNADSDAQFELAGFTQDPGYKFSQHYYLLEWRTHRGVDAGLAHIKTFGKPLPFNEGLVVWYVDSSFDNNWVGLHPGEGFLGVVDADQHVLRWSDGEVASTRFQVHDAAFSFKPSQRVYMDLTDRFGVTLEDNYIWPHWTFKDSRDYSSPEIPDAGRLLPLYGLNVRLLWQSWDQSVVTLLITKRD